MPVAERTLSSACLSALGAAFPLAGMGGIAPTLQMALFSQRASSRAASRATFSPSTILRGRFYGAAAGDEPGRADGLQHIGREVKAAPDHNVTCLGIIADQARADLLLACLRSGKGQGVVE